MSAIGVQSQINSDRALWLSSIPSDVIHGNILCDTIVANAGYISTFYSDNAEISSLKLSSLSLRTSDVSGMFVSSLRGNTAFFSTLTLASDLSGGVGFVRFSVDASGIQVDGDPIRFDNLLYITSSINIVQISTIVDTDIFAQNGFFSTLSTGSLSSGVATISTLSVQDLSANYGSFDSLRVSSLEAIDISGVASGKNWSLYPTLASSIIFQPAYILSNVGSQLYFAGQELTDASGGGQDWSIFPAFSTVQMANQSLVGLSTLVYQDGGRLWSATGNNLFYNGQPVQFGAISNVSQWARYPAVSNIDLCNYNLINANGVSTTNLSVLSNLYNNDYLWSYRLEVGGTTLTPLFAVTAGGDVVCRNLQVGDTVTSLADVNIYGSTALPGDSALYVEGGVQFDGGTIHGFSAGLLPVAGINTGRIDMLQAGFNLLHPLVGAITTGAALGITSGGAMSLAAGGYLEVNTSTIQCINTTQGNKNTTLQTGFITVDPDIAATSSVKLFNVLGGGVEIDGGGQGSLIGFSTLQGSNLSSINVDLSTINGVPIAQIQTPSNIVASNVFVDFSTVTSSFLTSYAGISTSFVGTEFAVSSVITAARLGSAVLINSLVGFSNPGFSNESQILNISTIQGGNLSTVNLQVSTINGLPWDISGGGGGALTNNFSTLTASSFIVSSMVGQIGGIMNLTGALRFEPQNGIQNCIQINTDQTRNLDIAANNLQIGAFSTIMGGKVYASDVNITSAFVSSTQVSSLAGYNFGVGIGTPGSTIKVSGGFEFVDDAEQTPGNGGRFLSSLRYINSRTQSLTIDSANLFLTTGSGSGNIRLGGGGAFDTHIVPYQGQFLVSTIGVLTSSIITPGILDVSGSVKVGATNWLQLGDVSGVLLERRVIASTSNILAVTNTTGVTSNNMNPVAASDLWLAKASDTNAAVRFHTSSVTHGDYRIESFTSTGTVAFTYAEGFYEPLFLNPGYLQNFYGVSTLVGFPGDIGLSTVTIKDAMTTSSITVSSINGLPYPESAAGFISTLTVSSLNFSSASSYTSNTAYNYPILIEHDAAGATSNSGSAIAIRGHNFSVGSVVNQLELGWRVTGENYIASVWPGQNLEDLTIESSQLLITNGIQSSFMNYAGYALQTGNDILVGETLIAPTSISTLYAEVSTVNCLELSTQQSFISSMNGMNAIPAYANYLQTSSMVLYQNSTTLLAWDVNNNTSNFTVSGYDLIARENGVYKIGVSLQLNNQSGNDAVWLFFQKNNTSITLSASQFNIQNNVEDVIYVETIEPLNSTDAIEIGLYTTSADITLSTIGSPAAGVPDSPAAILTCYKVG